MDRDIEILVQTKLPITEQDLRDIICAGYEGGIGYWYCSLESKREDLDYISITGIDAEVASECDSDNLEQLRNDHVEQHGKLWTIDSQLIELGIKRFFEKGAWRESLHKALVEGDVGMIDAEDADLLIQLGIFNEIVYG